MLSPGDVRELIHDRLYPMFRDERTRHEERDRREEQRRIAQHRGDRAAGQRPDRARELRGRVRDHLAPVVREPLVSL